MGFTGYEKMFLIYWKEAYFFSKAFASDNKKKILLFTNVKDLDELISPPSNFYVLRWGGGLLRGKNFVRLHRANSSPPRTCFKGSFFILYIQTKILPLVKEAISLYTQYTLIFIF